MASIHSSAPPERAQARAELAAVEAQWEKALAAYKEALIQNRDRDLIDKALKMYKQIADLEGADALDREIRFCRSAVLCYPYDVALLSHLAELYFQTGQGSMGRTLCAQILEIDPENDYAKKRLEAAAPTL